MTKSLKFEGVFPANPTPYKDGKILEEALRGIFEDNISHGVNGFWVGGSTGEGPILDDSQRETVARITGESCNGRVISIMHVGAISTQSSIKGAKAAYDSGCDAICCVPPFFFPTDTEQVIEHYKRVSGASNGLPMFVYNLPRLTNFETTPSVMEKIIKEVPNIVGLKHSSVNFSDIVAFTEMGLKCFNGNSLLALPSLSLGAVGNVDAPPSIAPWLYVKLHDYWKNGDIESAKKIQSQLPKIVSLTRMYDSQSANTKLILGERIGIDCGVPILPKRPLTENERKIIIQKANELKLINL